MRAAFCAELRKAHRRHDILVILLLEAIVALCIATSTQEPETGYSFLFYTVPIYNAIISSAGMAVLATRIWDVETKGNSCRLLFTLQSRSSLYAAKALLGTCEIAAFCLLECALVVACSVIYAFTEPLSLSQLLWLLVCTFVVSLMLFLFSLALCLRCATPVPAVAAGLAGSLVGLFSGFMPRTFSYFIPWGYFIPLSAMEMGWDSVTRDTWFTPLSFCIPLLLVSIGFALLLLAVGYSLIRNKEV